MRTRAATELDAPAIAAVEGESAHAPWSVESVRATLARPTTLAWVVEVPQVAAHLLATSVTSEAEILALTVTRSHRRQGLASALLEAAVASWRQRDVRTAWLEVRADNPAAIALYEARGWVRSGTRSRYYADGTDALVYRLDLP